jgi:hypothetical protein
VKEASSPPVLFVTASAIHPATVPLAGLLK